MTMATAADYERIGDYASMHDKDKGINRYKCTRTVPLEVICPAYSRTGTLSMRNALRILGYADPYHFSSIYSNIQDCDVWHDLIQAKYEGKGQVTKKKFDGVIGHCGAVTDNPCHLFAPELIQFYPDAKIVLVERDIDSWYRSWDTFLEGCYDPVFPIIAKLDPFWLGRIARLGVESSRLEAGSAKNITAARARSKDEYRKHYALVRTLVPPERLLEFKLEDGWEPLCKFLGKEMPKEPFPRLNDSKQNQQVFKELAAKGMKRVAWNVFVVAMAIAGAAFAVYRYRRR